MKFLNELTVVIVTYKTNREILDNCIDSIDPSVKILIVENSSDIEFKKEMDYWSKESDAHSKEEAEAERINEAEERLRKRAQESEGGRRF